MISGFQCTLKVDDAGTGAAFGGASTAFSGLVTISFSEQEMGKFNATEIDQVYGGSTPDPIEREYPTGLIQRGPTQCEMKYNKANYQRLVALLEKGRGYTYILTTPDDLTTPGTPVKLVLTIKGFVSKLGQIVFDKGQPVKIPFEITFQERGTAA